MSETLIRFDSWLYFNTEEENWYLVVFINGTEIACSMSLSKQRAFAFLEKTLKEHDPANFMSECEGIIQKYNLLKDADAHDLSELERKCALKALKNMKKEINNAYGCLLELTK